MYNLILITNIPVSYTHLVINVQLQIYTNESRISLKPSLGGVAVVKAFRVNLPNQIFNDLLFLSVSIGVNVAFSPSYVMATSLPAKGLPSTAFN